LANNGFGPSQGGRISVGGGLGFVVAKDSFGGRVGGQLTW